MHKYCILLYYCVIYFKFTTKMPEKIADYK